MLIQMFSLLRRSALHKEASELVGAKRSGFDAFRNLPQNAR
jgi:hypothetical protein